MSDAGGEGRFLQPCSELLLDFLHLGETSDSSFREQELPVEFHLEDAVAALDQGGFDPKPLLQLLRQTGGSREVVSDDAILDGQLGHGGSSGRSVQQVPLTGTGCDKIRPHGIRRPKGKEPMKREPEMVVVEEPIREDGFEPLPGEPFAVKRVAAKVKDLLRELDLDLSDHNLHDTDLRVARLYLEMFRGLREGAEPKVTTFPNEEGYSHLVMETQIPFYSMCAHHLVPFYGQAHMAYIPAERILGLSKFARILEFYAKRPQLQERLTEQVVGFLERKLRPQGAMVVIEARHLCVEMRGVKKPGAVTITSAIRGVFHKRAVREEFLDLLKRG